MLRMCARSALRLVSSTAVDDVLIVYACNDSKPRVPNRDSYPHVVRSSFSDFRETGLRSREIARHNLQTQKKNKNCRVFCTHSLVANATKRRNRGSAHLVSDYNSLYRCTDCSHCIVEVDWWTDFNLIIGRHSLILETPTFGHLLQSQTATCINTCLAAVYTACLGAASLVSRAAAHLVDNGLVVGYWY